MTAEEITAFERIPGWQDAVRLRRWDDAAKDPDAVIPGIEACVAERRAEGRRTMTQKPPRLPPRWFIQLAWKVHRGVYRATGGRLGLWRPRPGGWGTSLLTTTGRRTGRLRSVMVGYFTDGPNLVTMAMNGWGEAEPAWWLNLQADPDATVMTRDGQLPVRARAALGEERDRLWARWRDLDQKLDGFAARRPGQTAVVVLEPQPDR